MTGRSLAKRLGLAQQWRVRIALASFGFLLAACAPVTPPAPVPAKVEPVVTSSVKLLTWPDLLNRPMPEPTHHVSTGALAQQKGTLWLPSEPGPHPVVIMIHGGCWQKHIADLTIMNWAAEDLRRRGIAVWNIEYRGVDEPGGGYPGTFNDVAQGAEKLNDLGPFFNLKTDKVVAFGHSAGGHLAMWLAARPKLPPGSPGYWDEPLKITAVVNSGGLADLAASKPVTQADCLADIMGKLTGPASATRLNPLYDTSPAELLPLGVKQVSVNGAQDRIAPPLLGEGWTRKAKAAGDDASVVIVPDTGHVELITPGTAAWEVEAKIIADLLR